MQKPLGVGHLAPNAYEKAPGPWWDNYESQADAILDEIDKQQIPFGQWDRGSKERVYI